MDNSSALRRWDSNPRSSAYEADEMPDFSTAQGLLYKCDRRRWLSILCFGGGNGNGLGCDWYKEDI